MKRPADIETSPSLAVASGAKTRAEDIRRQLADEIVIGQVAPGERLDEAGLAARFGVSRTPIREALRQLTVMGLVDSRPHRGVVVIEITAEKLTELFELMTELEATCARLAAQRMTPAERRELGGIHDLSRIATQEGDGDTYRRLNQAFHAAICAGSHNRFLIDATNQTRYRANPFRNAQFRQVGRLKRSYEEHDAVVDAILRGDAAGAERAIREHVQTSSAVFNTVAGHSEEKTDPPPA